MRLLGSFDLDVEGMALAFRSGREKPGRPQGRFLWGATCVRNVPPQECTDPMPLEALVFDVDGTLAETEEIHRRAYNATFASLGLEWVWDEGLYRELLQIPGSRERLKHYIMCSKPPAAEWALEHFDEIQSQRVARYFELVKSGAVVARPGACRLIREAHAQNVPLAIATTSLLVNVEALLRKLFGDDGPSWFTVIAAGDVVARKKPAPDVYLYALEKLGCAAATAIAFEDSYNGVAAATAAGLMTVAAPSAYLANDDLSMATSLMTDLGEPDRPLRPLGGWRFSKGYVDLAGLRELVSQCDANPRGRGSAA
jgi:beta-phosphoglucomutase-like phosphatase (HAD superfamily)